VFKLSFFCSQKSESKVQSFASCRWVSTNDMNADRSSIPAWLLEKRFETSVFIGKTEGRKKDLTKNCFGIFGRMRVLLFQMKLMDSYLITKWVKKIIKWLKTELVKKLPIDWKITKWLKNFQMSDKYQMIEKNCQMIEKITKWLKNYQMIEKITKWAKKLPNEWKIPWLKQSEFFSTLIT
jgi:hypothetical protein